MPDVIAELIAQLDAEQGPRLPWVILRSSAGDPLPAAWSTCDDPLAMARLLVHTHRAELVTDALLAVAAEEPRVPARGWQAARARLRESAQVLRADPSAASGAWRVVLAHAIATAPRAIRGWIAGELCAAFRARLPALALRELLPDASRT